MKKFKFENSFVWIVDIYSSTIIDSNYRREQVFRWATTGRGLSDEGYRFRDKASTKLSGKPWRRS